MKKILLITLVAVFAFYSCTEDSAGVSKLTTYATMTLKGPQNLFWPLNTAFVDPGCTAYEGTKDITSKIGVSSNVDATKGGKYSITYKVQNSDGFYANTTRTVYVYDATAPLNGYYQSNVHRNNAGTLADKGPYTILLFGVGDDTYLIEDLLGGWYYIGAAYGSAYAGSARIKLNADNTFTIVSADPLAWGYPCLFTAPSTYDPAAKTLVLYTRMEDVTTMLFTVTLNNPTPLN